MYMGGDGRNVEGGAPQGAFGGAGGPGAFAGGNIGDTVNPSQGGNAPNAAFQAGGGGGNYAQSNRFVAFAGAPHKLEMDDTQSDAGRSERSNRRSERGSSAARSSRAGSRDASKGSRKASADADSPSSGELSSGMNAEEENYRGKATATARTGDAREVFSGAGEKL